MSLSLQINLSFFLLFKMELELLGSLFLPPTKILVNYIMWFFLLNSNFALSKLFFTIHVYKSGISDIHCLKTVFQDEIKTRKTYEKLE